MNTIARLAKWLRQRLLKPSCAGSNPAAGANLNETEQRPMTDKTLDEKIAEAKAADLLANWQRHREECLRLAIDSGCSNKAESIIIEAEKFSHYILNGKAKT